MIVIGCDPGLGVRSPTGIAVIDTKDATILDVKEMWCSSKRLVTYKKLGELSYGMTDIIGPYYSMSKDVGMLFVNEYFVMKGKGGESLQRLIGAYHAAVPQDVEVIEIQNVKVKQYLGVEGRGDSSKEDVGEGVHRWFLNKNAESTKIVRNLINEGRWDALDALAIGISGWLEYTK